MFTQLSQALGSGVLRGDEFNRMAESMPSILGAVASELGVAQTELRGMAADGKISAEVVVKALQGVAASGGDLEKFLDPSAKAFNTLKQATEEVFVQLGKLLGPAVIAGMNVLSMIVKKLAEYWEYVGAVLLPKVVKALNPIIEAVKKVTAGIKLETIIEMIQGGLIIAIKAITVAIKLLSPVVVFLIERFAELAQNPVFKFIAEQVGRLVTHLGKAREGIDQFKAGQDAATASGMNLVKQSSQLPPKIEDAKENTKQLKEAQDAVTKAISESSEAIDKTAAINQAIADQRSSSAAAYLQAEMQVNDVLLDQLNRQLDGAKTQQDRVKIAGDIYKLTVTQAKLEFEASKIQISAAVEKAHLALQATQLKAKEVQLAVELAAAEGTVNDKHRKSLALAGDAEKLASIQLGTTKLIAEQQMRGANALLQGKIQAAGAAFESNILAKNTNSAASAAERLATGFQQAADAASSMSNNTTTKAIYGATTTTKTLPAGAIVTDKFGRSQTVGGSAAPRTEHIVPQSKEAGFATVSGSSAIPSGGGGSGGGLPTISIQTGPVMQINGQNYVTTQDLSSAVQAGVQQTLNMMRNDRGTRRAVGLA